MRRCWLAARLRRLQPLHRGIAAAQQFVGAGSRPIAVTSVSAGPPLVGLYLKPPSSGGLCDGVTTMPSASAGGAATVVDEDGARNDRRRGDAVIALDDRLDPVRRQHFERGALGRAGQRVGVLADVERAVDALRMRR